MLEGWEKAYWLRCLTHASSSLLKCGSNALVGAAQNQTYDGATLLNFASHAMFTKQRVFEKFLIQDWDPALMTH